MRENKDREILYTSFGWTYFDLFVLRCWKSEQIYLFAFHCGNVKQKEESLAVFHQPGSGSRMISPLPPYNSRVPGEVRILRGNGGSVLLLLLQVCTWLTLCLALYFCTLSNVPQATTYCSSVCQMKLKNINLNLFHF